MATDNVNVRIRGELKNHLQQQIGEDGLFENASEYIRALIRNDLQSRNMAWEWLQKHLEPALREDESVYIEVSADDVITRNRGE